MRLLLYVGFIWFLSFLAVAQSAISARNLSSVSHNDLLMRSPAAVAYADNCFNCLLPAYECMQFGDCRQYDGHCDCPPGFGGDDCSVPLCGSLSNGKDRMPREGKSCQCDDGWEGINCNVCVTDEACDAFMPEGTGGVCFHGGLGVKENFQMCNVTNRKILDILDGQIPQVTFSCNMTSDTCNFQFWIDEVESFYCGLNSCQFSEENTGNANKTLYECSGIECSCIPDRMLCGQDGSIDITDFLTEAIKGPASFSCDSSTKSCDFSEPAMDDLIESVFGDKTILLQCRSSECLHYSELPDYNVPVKRVNKNLLFFGIAVMLVFLLLVALCTKFVIAKLQDKTSDVKIPSEDETYKLMTGHQPSSLLFNDIKYSVGTRRVLNGISGIVKPGELLAIMGASGAGKTSLLDILAHKQKEGSVSGDILVNGFKVTEAQFKTITGFVDQEDALMPTLTVYETILNSALLRLPKSMSYNAKRLRVLETMNELGIMNIKDQYIGSESQRGISGGEKRRVVIACELVTSPSIVFLDEPTSGLDSFNAFNVVECLRSLAQTYKRTVLFTIHQPRSNIVALFDRLLLLSYGEMVYSGFHDDCQGYFSSIGYDCPPGFNLADFLIDLTMTASKAVHTVNGHNDSDELSISPTNGLTNGDAEWVPLASRQPQQDNTEEIEGPLPNSAATHTLEDTDLNVLVQKYKDSNISQTMQSEIQQNIDTAMENSDRIPAFLTRDNKIGIFEQFTILSVRTFKNLYRNPMLLLTHYLIGLVLSVLCGYLYYNISNDISGFQNRLGLFLFLLALFGFSTLTSLQVFASERQIFVRERANRFYHPLAYYASKVLFDVIPLRVFPPVMVGLIIYPLVGLNFEDHAMAKFLLALMMFNLAAAAICLFIGVMIKDTSVASLIGSLVMLFSLLFAGLLLNRDSIPRSALWAQNLSIFHYALEAMVVNEVRYLTLVEYKFGLSIEVPGATILSTFGFTASAYWSDLSGLIFIFCLFIVLAYIGMHFFLVEKR
ncbi:hypothetical protein V1511DRAFT_505391 [Dipodascopsis uninucleata]